MSDLLPKQTCIGAGCMSAKCQKRTLCGASNLHRRNQGHQSDAACDGKGRAVEKHRRMADMVPQQSGNDARYQA
jgi:hypothetical protein